MKKQTEIPNKQKKIKKRKKIFLKRKIPGSGTIEFQS
jgi:hypothetical protein